MSDVRYMSLASRIVAAIAGGYALGALVSVAALALPVPATRRAWLGLGLAALPLLAICAGGW